MLNKKIWVWFLYEREKGLVTAEIIVKENKIEILRIKNTNYILLTDLVKY